MGCACGNSGVHTPKSVTKKFNSIAWQREVLKKEKVGAFSENIEELEAALYKIRKVDFPRFREKMLREIREETRWTMWKVALNLQAIKKEGKYEELVLTPQDEKWSTYIKNDVPRTFTELNFFGESERAKLGRVLNAFSLYNPEIGYCQGLNYMAGFLLLISGMQEEDSFWALVAMNESSFQEDVMGVHGIAGIYENDFPLTTHYLKAFEQIFAQKMPALKEHFAKLEFVPAMWLYKWIMVFFLLTLPYGYCLYFWDHAFCFGPSFCFNVVFVLLEHFEEEFMKCDMPGCFALIREFESGSRLPSISTLFSRAVSINIPSIPFKEEKQPEVAEIIRQNSLKDFAPIAPAPGPVPI